MKNKKIKLSEKDMHIIDVYSKKNLSDTGRQFEDMNEKPADMVQELTAVKNER